MDYFKDPPTLDKVRSRIRIDEVEPLKPEPVTKNAFNYTKRKIQLELSIFRALHKDPKTITAEEADRILNERTGND